MLLLTAPKTVPSTQGFVTPCANKKLLKPQEYYVLRTVIAAKLHVLTFAVDVFFVATRPTYSQNVFLEVVFIKRKKWYTLRKH